MPATQDLTDVRTFTAELESRMRQCDNGEGMICSSLDGRITHYASMCAELRDYIQEWARKIFTGAIALDPESEALLRDELRTVCNRATGLAAEGRAMNGVCFILEGLDTLHGNLLAARYLLENWISPRLAVSPAPRVEIPDSTKQEIVDSLERLPPLPSDWRPGDPAQLARFNRQRAAR